MYGEEGRGCMMKEERRKCRDEKDDKVDRGSGKVKK